MMMVTYFISILVVFILFIIAAKYGELEDFSYLWLLFLSAVWPLVFLAMLVDIMTDFLVNKLKEKK